MKEDPAWTPPRDDEVEVSIFGRGAGEALVLHLGQGRWMAVDSMCAAAGEPVALTYLERIGVRVEDSVRLVLMSHWDSDHVRGAAKLFGACSAAAFVMAPTLQDPAAVRVIAARGDARNEGKLRRWIDELANVYEELARRGDGAKLASEGTLLWEKDDLRVCSLSPSSGMQAESLVKSCERARRGADVKLDPKNHLSIVLWVEAGPHRILLGGDLEQGPFGGWSAVLSSEGRRDRRAAVFKIPHHGSGDAHLDDVWDEALEPGPWALLTPFGRDVPKTDDRRRIRGLAGHAYQAGAHPVRPARTMEIERLIALGPGRLTSAARAFGHVRLRAPMDTPGKWTVATFGSAGPL